MAKNKPEPIERLERIEDYIKDLCIKNEALEEENKSLKDGLSIMEKAYDNLNNKWDVVIGELRTLLHNV
jgi:predicted nuclease with TOPRIM domain